MPSSQDKPAARFLPYCFWSKARGARRTGTETEATGPVDARFCINNRYPTVYWNQGLGFAGEARPPGVNDVPLPLPKRTPLRPVAADALVTGAAVHDDITA